MRRVYTIEAVVVALLVLAFYHPLLRFGYIQSGGDSANLFWPVKLLIQESIWRDGVVPLWNPYSFMGAPLAASLQHAVFHPVEWIIYGIFPAHVGLNVGNLFHLVLAGVGAWAWLRIGHGVSRVPAIACGAAFPCCAWFWGQQEHINQVAAISYLPLQALFTWLLLTGRLRGNIFVLVYTALGALQFMTGHPQEAFYAHVFCGLLVAGRVLLRGDGTPGVRDLIRVYTLTALIAGLLVSVQLLMTMELESHSRRQFKDPLYAISFSMPPDLLATYLSPHRFGSFRDGYFVRLEDGSPALEADGSAMWDRRAYGEYGLYTGVPMLLLALLAVIARHPRRRFACFLLGVVVVCSLLAMGGNTDPRRVLAMQFTEFPQPGWSLHEILLRLFPPARGFRVPARIVTLSAFALVTAGALGFAWLIARLSAGRMRCVAAGAVGAAILAALYIPSRREKFHFPVEMEPTLRLMELAGSKSRSLDERVFRLTISDDNSLIAERHFESTFADGNPIFNRMRSLQPHMNAAAHVPMVDGYEEGLVPTARMKDFLYAFNRNFRRWRPDGQLLMLLGVRHVYTEPEIDADEFPRVSSGLLSVRVHENPRWRGAAFWADDVKGIDFTRLDGPWWRGGQPLPEIQGEAVEYGRMSAEPEAAHRLLRTSLPTLNSIIVGSTGESGGGDALLALGWYPGWMLLDGEGARPVRFVSAVHASLPADAMIAKGGAGMSRGWRLAFRPFSYELGLFLTALGVGLWMFVLQYAAIRRRNGLTGAAPAHD